MWMWSNCVGFWHSDDHRVRQLFARESQSQTARTGPRWATNIASPRGKLTGQADHDGRDVRETTDAAETRTVENDRDSKK